jgi:ABC-type transporter MlaC component
MFKPYLRVATIFLLSAVVFSASAQAQQDPRKRGGGSGGGSAARGAPAAVRAAPPAFRPAPTFHAAPAFRPAPAARLAPPARNFAAPAGNFAPRVAPQRQFSTPRSAPSFNRQSARPRILDVPSRSAGRPTFRGRPTANLPSRPSRADLRRARGNPAGTPNAGGSPRNGQPPARIATPGGRNTPATAGNRRALSSPVLRNPAFANRAFARGARGRNPTLAAAAFRGRFARTGGANRHWWWRRGHVIGWVGPLFWPYASYDVFDYTFYPYYEDTFWPYAYDDVYEGMFGAYSYIEPGQPAARRAKSAAKQTSGTGTASMPQLCTQSPAGLTDFPIERITETVQPNDQQKALLDKLKDATAKAVEILQSACPTDLPSTPPGRMQALEQRLEAMVTAVDTVRVPLQEFYNSLTDEQKARFNAVERDPDVGNQRVAKEEQSELTKTCSAGSGITDVPIQRIAQVVRPTGAQRDALNELKDAVAQASEALKANCPTFTALTPVGRVELMEQRLKTLLQAVRTVRPALDKFYASLSDEQKERFNTMGAQG